MATKKTNVAENSRIEDGLAFVRAWGNEEFGVGILKAMLGNTKEGFIAHVRSMSDFMYPGVQIHGMLIEINVDQMAQFYGGYYEDQAGSRRKVTGLYVDHFFKNTDWDAYGKPGMAYRKVPMDVLDQESGGEKPLNILEEDVMYLHVQWQPSENDTNADEDVCYKVFTEHLYRAINDVGTRGGAHNRKLFLPLSYVRHGIEKLTQLIAHHNKAVVKVVPGMTKICYDLTYAQNGFTGGPVGWPVVMIRAARARDSKDKSLGL